LDPRRCRAKGRGATFKPSDPGNPGCHRDSERPAHFLTIRISSLAAAPKR
jgi:hypothetical protein